jgi:hypothetical protein
MPPECHTSAYKDFIDAVPGNDADHFAVSDPKDRNGKA